MNGLFFGETSPGPSPGISDGLIGVVVLGFTAGGGGTDGVDAAGAGGLTAGGGVVAVGGLAGVVAMGGGVVVDGGGTLTTDGGGVVAPLNCPEEMPLSVSPLATV